MRYPSCRAAASLSHVFLTRSRRQAMATTAPLLSPQHARPAHLPRRLPPPLHLASHLDVPAKRMRLRRAPPPCTAKFGKFDASDAPARGGRVGGSCSGRWGGAARGGGRQVRLTAPSTRACVIENTKDADVLGRPLLCLCGSAACHRIWRARFGSRGRRALISSTPEACELSYDSHCAYCTCVLLLL